MIRFISILFIVVSQVLLATSGNGQPEKKFYDINDAEIIFNQYKEEYGKTYRNETELRYRFKIFKETLRNINKWNAMYPLTVFDLNRFSDQTNREIIQLSTGFVMDFRRRGHEVTDYVPIGGAPDELDYRKQNLVTEVKNQGDCGSSYVFSAIGNIEGQYAKKYGKLVSLSEQQCLDCYKEIGGCYEGWIHNVDTLLVSAGGSMTTKDYPYNGKDFENNTCQFDKQKVVAKVKSANIYYGTSEENLKDMLASDGPLATAIYASRQMASYKSGIFKVPCEPDVLVPNHGMVLVGYGSEGGTDYWIIKNSWSEKWGEDGYIRFAKGVNQCFIGFYTVSATVE